MNNFAKHRQTLLPKLLLKLLYMYGTFRILLLSTVALSHKSFNQFKFLYVVKKSSLVFIKKTTLYVVKEMYFSLH